MSRSLLPLLLALPLLSACSDEPADFRTQAARHCTEVVNDHLVSQQDDSGLEVLLALQSGEEPTAEQLAGWSDAVAADLERRESVRAGLAELSSGDESEQRAWEVVDAGDANIEFVSGRAELLGTQDWEQIRAEFAPGGSPGGLPEEALTALGLQGTDCQWVHQTAVLAGSADFVRDATTACTEIGNRRFAAGFEADAGVSLDLLGEIT